MNKDDQRKALEWFAKAVMKRYADALSEVNATGATMKSMQAIVTDETVDVLAGLWFPAIDTGRKKATGDSGKRFHEALKRWVVKKDDFKLGYRTAAKRYTKGNKSQFENSQLVNLNNAVKSLRYQINKHGTKTAIKNRHIVGRVRTDDLERDLIQKLGRNWLDRIEGGVLYRVNKSGTMSQLVRVKQQTKI